MRLPTVVRLGPHALRVRLAAQDELDGYGEFLPTRLEVRVREDLPPSLQLSTLIHELLEAISEFHCLELDERAINAIGEGLAQALGPQLGLKEADDEDEAEAEAEAEAAGEAEGEET